MLSVRASRAGLHEITDSVESWLADSGISEGLLTIFCRHTSASLLIQENAAGSARRDLERYFERLAPVDARYEHNDEGADDMPAHLRAALTQTTLTVPVANRRMTLGTWQGIYLFEHRTSAPARHIALHVIGE